MTEPKTDEHPELTHAVSEIKRTFDDLRALQPGLNIACLITAPLPNDSGQSTASFFATGNLKAAAHVMHRMVLEQEQRVARSQPAPDDTPAAS